MVAGPHRGVANEDCAAAVEPLELAFRVPPRRTRLAHRADNRLTTVNLHPQDVTHQSKHTDADELLHSSVHP
jgi:hypothetical protein